MEQFFLSLGSGTTGNYYIATTIAGDNVLGYYGGPSQNTGMPYFEYYTMGNN